MHKRPLRYLIFLHVLSFYLFIPADGPLITCVSEDRDIRYSLQYGPLQMIDCLLIHAVHLRQNDHDGDRIFLPDLTDHLLVGFEEPVICRGHAIPHLMNMAGHIFRVVTDLLSDGAEHIFHELIFIRSDIITLAVIQSDEGSFRAVRMDTAGLGPSLVSDLGTFRIAHLENVPYQRTLPHARRAAYQYIRLFHLALYLLKCIVEVKIFIIKFFHIRLPVTKIMRAFRNHEFSVFKMRPQLRRCSLLTVVDPILRHLLRDTERIDDMLCLQRGIYMVQDCIFHHLNCRLIPGAFRKMHDDQLFEPGLHQRHIRRVVPASAVPVQKMMYINRIIHQRERRRSHHNSLNIPGISVIQAVIIRIVKLPYQKLRGRVRLLLKALPGQTGKYNSVIRYLPLKHPLYNLRELPLRKDRSTR